MPGSKWRQNFSIFIGGSMGPSEALRVCWGRLFCCSISLSASDIAGQFACTHGPEADLHDCSYWRNVVYHPPEQCRFPRIFTGSKQWPHLPNLRSLANSASETQERFAHQAAVPADDLTRAQPRLKWNTTLVAVARCLAASFHKDTCPGGLLGPKLSARCLLAGTASHRANS